MANKWYTLQVFEDGEWKDAGNVYEEDTKRQCRSEMVKVNFWGKRVRMVENQVVSRQIGKVKDFR